MKVLIVDDSLLAEHALKSFFEKLGHEIVGLARNGEIAKELYQSTNPDLVTVDAVMPGISGSEFIKFVNIEDRNAGKNTKILMISSDEMPESEKKELQVNDYILKPVTLDKIRESLDRIHQ